MSLHAATLFTPSTMPPLDRRMRPAIIRQALRCFALIAVLGVIGVFSSQASEFPAPKEADFIVKDFLFASGEVFPALRMHYRVLGEPERGPDGRVKNAVLVLHGTGSSGAGFMDDIFAGELFGPGQPLDVRTHWVIIPDSIGHGSSSKPSDGLHARFPAYTYDDMVDAQYRLLTEGLGVNHLLLVIGTSMGGMHTWIWGERYPDYVDHLMPLASLPEQISGRNRVWRRAEMDAIRNDPAWNGGEYRKQPVGLRVAEEIQFLMLGSSVRKHAEMPGRAEADAVLDRYVDGMMTKADANDVLYALNASRTYNPGPALGAIKARLFAVNFGDDLTNPPELGVLEREIVRVHRGKAVVVPAGPATYGHLTNIYAAVWKRYLTELLAPE